MGRAIVLMGLLAGVTACDAGSAGSVGADVHAGSDGDAAAPGDAKGDAKDVASGGDAAAGPSAPFDWCTPDTAPDDACHAAKRDPSSERVALATEIAGKQMELHPPESLGWDWGEAVLLWSLVELHSVTGDPALLAYAKAWMDSNIANGFTISTSDSCAPVAIAAALYRETGDEAYAAVVDKALTYLSDLALRTDGGAISHFGTIPVVSVWVDSLFMFGNVWMAWWQATGDVASLDALGEQIRAFSALLQDDGGLFRHAWGWNEESPTPAHWARGNGWVVASVAQYLRARRIRGEEDAEVADSLRRLLEGVAQTQGAASGLWWTLLDHPGEAYEETSASALFAYGMARAWRSGLAGDEVLPRIERAMGGVLGRITRDGQGRPVVTGISGPTTAGFNEQYAKVPLVDDISYGVGAVILALVETSGLPDQGGDDE